jgi:hypothetical protein
VSSILAQTTPSRRRPLRVVRARSQGAGARSSRGLAPIPMLKIYGLRI